MVAVESVPRGLACNCRCPQCGLRLIARQGEIVSWHFAHEAEETNCAGAFETMTHRLAKQIIADAGRIALPPLIGYFEATAIRVVEKEREIALADVRLEATLPGIRPDILARADDGMDLAIEVYVAHRSGEEKITRIRERKLATFEIDLSGFRRGLSSGDIFPEAVLRGSERLWLWHPRQGDANEVVAAEEKARRAAAQARAEEVRLRQEEERRRREEAARWAEERLRQAQAELQRQEAERQRAEAEAARERQRIERERREELPFGTQRLFGFRAEHHAALVAGMLASAAAASEQRIDYLRSRPRLTVARKDAPTCQCGTSFLWRDDLFEPWRCFVCDPPPHGRDSRRIDASCASSKASPGPTSARAGSPGIACSRANTMKVISRIVGTNCSSRRRI
jgi:hypothetical protein